MRRRICFTVSLASLVVLAAAGCGQSPIASEGTAFSVNSDGTVNRPFQAALTTSSNGATPDATCGAPPIFRERQVGEGEATMLGRFTVVFTFCIDPTAALDGLEEGEAIPYWDGIGTFTAANGDQLIMAISGEIGLSDDPAWDLSFHDDFEWVGGTGRFAGASGAGSTDSYIIQSPNFVVHDMGGTLTFHPGR